MGEAINRDIAAALETCRRIPWIGEVWRCHGRKYAGNDAGGSLKVSGRFNRGVDKFPAFEIWLALYTSLGEHVALGERLRHTTAASLNALANQRLSRLGVDLQVVLEVCAPAACTDFALPGWTIERLCQPGEYAETHELARIAREFVEAILIPSCTRFPEGNLIIFPDRLRSNSRIWVIECQDPDLIQLSD